MMTPATPPSCFGFKNGNNCTPGLGVSSVEMSQLCAILSQFD